MWYAYPTRLGAATFSTSLGEGGFFLENASISTDNSAGYTENYFIYRSNQAYTADASNPVTFTITIS
tara:strand:- start:610 stop:810 length:201 start_codon:yes stop_codon:yes gene_type:complete